MPLDYAIEIGDLVLNDEEADENGAFWTVLTFDGWECPTVRMTLLDITGTDGQAVGEAVYGPLAVVVEGDCVAPSIDAMWASQDRLFACVTPKAEVDLIVHETFPRSVPVRLVSPMRVKLYGGGRSFRFQVPLIAPNPAKQELVS